MARRCSGHYYPNTVFGLARSCILIAAVLLVVPISSARGENVRYTFRFSESDFSFDKLLGYDIVRMADGAHIQDLGKPWLPYREYRVAMPSGMAVRSVTVESVVQETLPDRYEILPSQKPLKIGDSFDVADFISPDPAIYGSTGIYPGSPVMLIMQTDLFGQSFAVIDVMPLGYSPVAGTLTLYTTVTVIIEGDQGYVCGDYLPEVASAREKLECEDLLRTMAVNPEAVAAELALPGWRGGTALPPGGPFNHVIITIASWASYWNNLVTWHNKKGVRDTVITTEYIYSNYTGADNQEKIRNFVADAYNGWGTRYVLIGGENENVPFEYRIYVTDTIPSDEYYADFDDDWTNEVYVGRVTADGSFYINRFINKVIAYETDPPRTGYIQNAALLGMDLNAPPDPTATEELKADIDENWIPDDFSVTKIYDSDASNHKTAFIDALNAGQNLVNHSDHSNYWCLGTGDVNHDLAITYSDVLALTNTNKMSVIYSTGCYANRMDYNDCIAEWFILASDLKAGIAFTGNTRSGWYYQGDVFSLSLRFDSYWWKNLFTSVSCQGRLGNVLAAAKADCPIYNDYWKSSHWTLNLQGEPEMPVWTDAPDSFTVTHPGSVAVGPSTFSVNVKDFGGGDLQDAYVCLWKNGDLYATGYTDIAGDVAFDISPQTTGTMYVTVTQRNYIPYQGSAQVMPVNEPPVCHVPNDTTVACIAGQVCLPVSCSDPNGNLASGPTLISGPGGITNGNWCYAPSQSEVAAVTIECLDTDGLSCQASFNVALRYNHAPICPVIADTTIFMAAPGEIEIPVAASDSDANLAGCYVVTGPGSVVDGKWHYSASETDTIHVSLACEDSCELACLTTFSAAILFFVCGDANGDRTTNLADAVYLINYVFKGGPAPDPLCTGDANGDDAANLADAVYLVNYVFKEGLPPVEPCCP